MFNGFKKRFLQNWINRMTPFKHNSLKLKLFNKIPGCKAGKNTIIVGPIYLNGCTLEIGENVHLGRMLNCEGNGHIFIGNNVDIAPEVTFLTGTHKIGTSERRAGCGETNNIEVGDGTWIGARSTILGVLPKRTIGCGVVIAGCSNVIKDIKDNVLVAGNPAIVKKEL